MGYTGKSFTQFFKRGVVLIFSLSPLFSVYLGSRDLEEFPSFGIGLLHSLIWVNKTKPLAHPIDKIFNK